MIYFGNSCETPMMADQGYQKGIITHLKKLKAVRKDQLWNGIRVMVRVGKVSNFEWIVQLTEQWHSKKVGD